MKINTEYKTDNFFRISMEYFAKLWKPFFKSNRNNLIFTLIFALIGGISMYLGEDIGFFYLGMATTFLIFYFSFKRQYKLKKKSMYEKLEKINVKISSFPKEIEWEFDDEQVRLKTALYEYKMLWKAFESSEIDNDILWLNFSKDQNMVYYILKEEMTDAQWKELLKLTKEKITDEK